MNKRIYTFLILLAACQIALGQYRHKRFTYFGIETGAKTAFFDVIDNGSELYGYRNFKNPVRGVFVEQEINYILSVSTGLYFAKQTMDFRFRRDGAYSSYEPIRTIQIPLHLRANIPLTYGTPEVRLVPFLGTSILFNQSNDESVIKGRILPDLADYYNGTLRRDLGKAFFFADAGLNIDLMFAKGVILSFGGNYSEGFTRMLQADLVYNVKKVNYRGEVTTNGSNVNLHVALKYPVSRFWRKGFQPPKSKKKKEKVEK
jgi:hypothetical protein